MRHFPALVVLILLPLPGNTADSFDSGFDLDDLRVKVSPELPNVMVMGPGWRSR